LATSESDERGLDRNISLAVGSIPRKLWFSPCPSRQKGHIYVDVYVYVMPARTTVLLREDVKDHLLRKVGPRGLSDAINEILAKSLFRSRETLFGADPWLNTKGLRDEREAHEDL